LAAIKPRIREDLATAELDGEAVIYDERSGDLHHLNPTATIIFSMCDGTSTVREMSGEIAEAFGVPADDVERQIRSLLKEFREAGLLNGA
jgi:PqqD family protein of HPr-rel-A system